MNYQRRFLITVMMLVPLLSMAEETQEQPSMELLEFLGEWETEEGEWLDPDELANDYFEQLLDANDREQKDE